MRREIGLDPPFRQQGRTRCETGAAAEVGILLEDFLRLILLALRWGRIATRPIAVTEQTPEQVLEVLLITRRGTQLPTGAKRAVQR